MIGNAEIGNCSICGEKNTIVARKYYFYDIKCDCCKDKHFEIVWYCKKCKDKVKPPKQTMVTIKPLEE